MKTEELKDKVADCLGKIVAQSEISYKISRGELTIFVPREKICAVCEALKEQRELDFNILTDVTAVDYLAMNKKPRFEVVYHLYSTNLKHRIRIKCAVPEDDTSIDSVVHIWQTANFHERETFDLMGIIFKNHPNLTRILMADDWEGHPLRKDYPLGGVKSFYFKRDTNPHFGEPPNLVPRIRFQEDDV